MASSRALTGGTNDVNPQPLRARVTLTALTTRTRALSSIALPVPVQRLGAGNRAQVLEILKIDWDWRAPFVGNAKVIGNGTVTITVSTRSNGTTNVPTFGCADPYSIMHIVEQAVPALPQTTEADAAGYVDFASSGTRDLTDGAGHGVLMGMDTIYIQFTAKFQHNATSTAPDCNLCIWYRWKNVGFSEYVGMVTSS